MDLDEKDLDATGSCLQGDARDSQGVLVAGQIESDRPRQWGGGTDEDCGIDEEGEEERED